MTAGTATTLDTLTSGGILSVKQVGEIRERVPALRMILSRAGLRPLPLVACPITSGVGAVLRLPAKLSQYPTAMGEGWEHVSIFCGHGDTA